MTNQKNAPIIKLPPYKLRSVATSLSETTNWGINLLRVPETWKTTQGEGVVGLVIDTGATNHIDLIDNMILDQCKSFVPGEGIFDENGHSTHCAGIIAALKNGIGVIGVAPKCKIITAKSLSKHGFGETQWIVKALDYAIELRPDFVSMSLGMNMDIPMIHSRIKKLHSMNIPVIAAAGNDGSSNRISYPAAYPETICVGALDRNLVRADYSNAGRQMDFAMPGSDIYSTFLNHQYVMMSGTSMATPFLAGVIALLLAKHKKQEAETGKNDCVTINQIRAHLEKYSIDKGLVGKDAEYGFGVVNPVDVVFESLLFVDKDGDQVEIPILVPKMTLWQKIKRFFGWFKFLARS
jgi:subtilisin family serine protease